MREGEGTRIIGTIRSIELQTVVSRLEGVPPREVTRLILDVERAVECDGEELDIENLSSRHYQGPAELLQRYEAGDRICIVTSAPGSQHIGTIKEAPLS